MGNLAIQPSLTGGELAPSLYGRVDLARYAISLKGCRNFVVQPYGGVKNRTGTRFIKEVKDSTKRTRLIPFQFNAEQTYVLEFGNLYMRVFKRESGASGAVVCTTRTDWATATAYAVGDERKNGTSTYRCKIAHTSGTFATDLAADNWILIGTVGSAVEVITPYTTAEVADLQFTQSADVITIAHPNHPPQQVVRFEHDSWAIGAFDYKNGPWLDTNANTTISVWTSASIGFITIYASSAIFTADKVGRLFKIEQKDYGIPWEVGKSIALNDIRRSDGKYYKALTAGTTGTLRPTQDDESSWTDGGVTWQYLHSGFGVAQITAVAGDHLSCTATVLSYMPDGGVVSGFGASKTVTATAVNSAGYIRCTSAGHGITVAGTGYFNLNVVGHDPIKGTALITVVDANTVDIWVDITPFSKLINAVTMITLAGTGYFQAAVTSGGSVSHKWAFGAWGDSSIGGPGYPSTVNHFKQRLWFASTISQPNFVWSSKTGNFVDFGTSSPIRDDDAVSARIASSRLDAIQAMFPMDALLVMTTGGHWVTETGQDNVIKPGIGFKSQGFYGASPLPVLGIGNSAVYVQAGGQVVRDLGYEYTSNSYASGDISAMSNHLLEGHSIVEWAYQQTPFSCVWMVRDDGVLLSMTYMREQQVVGWARHDTDGEYESVCVVTEDSEDALYCIVKRPVLDTVGIPLTVTVYDPTA